MRVALLLIFSIIAVKSNDIDEAWQYQMFKVPDLKDICRNVENTSNVNTKCKEQLNVVCGNISLLLTMVDASSKFPFTGLGYSTKMDLGNFDQCLAIDHTYEGGKILGEYCTEGLVIPDPFMNIPDVNTFYILSVCRPDACNASDYNELVESLLEPNFTEVYLDETCQKVTPSKEFSTTEIFTLSIFVMVVCLMVISTACDVYIYKIQNRGIHPLLRSFSVLSNGRKLLHISKYSPSKEQVEVLNGLRVISMMWIIAGHGFMSWERVPLVNDTEWTSRWTKYYYSGYILSAPMAVDTFFYISGFLMAFKYLQRKDKSVLSQVLDVPQFIIHRYLRLTPPLLMVYLVVISLFNRLGSGPLWRNNAEHANICTENWSAVFLYIQNYNGYENVCISQTWFLSAVMQLYLVSPLVLIPLSATLQKPMGFKKSMIGLIILNILCTFMPMAHKLYVQNYDNEYDAHSRLIDYFMGATLGAFMRERIDKPFLYMVKKSRTSVVNLVTWILTILGMLMIVMCFHLVEILDKYNVTVIFQSLVRPTWCLGLSWIVYSSYHKRGGFVNWILCRPIFQILGRLTYCIYLLHQSIIDYNASITRAPWYFTDYNAFYLFCGHYLASVILAIFWTLAFESPLIALEQYFGKTYNFILEKTSTSLQIDNNGETQFQNDVNNVSHNLSSKYTNSEELYKKSNEF